MEIESGSLTYPAAPEPFPLVDIVFIDVVILAQCRAERLLQRRSQPPSKEVAKPSGSNMKMVEQSRGRCSPRT